MKKILLTLILCFLMIMPTMAQRQLDLPIQIGENWLYNSNGKNINETVINSFTHKNQEYVEINTSRYFAFPYSFDASTTDNSISVSFNMIQHQQSLYLSKYGGIPIAPSSGFTIIADVTINGIPDHFNLTTSGVSFENGRPNDTNNLLYLELCSSLYCDGLNYGLQNNVTVEQDMVQYVGNGSVAISINSNAQLVPLNSTDYQMQYQRVEYAIKTSNYTLVYQAQLGKLTIGTNSGNLINYQTSTTLTPIDSVSIHYDTNHIPSRITQTEPLYNVSGLQLCTNNLIKKTYILQQEKTHIDTKLLLPMGIMGIISLAIIVILRKFKSQ